MNPIATQQAALDNALVPPEKRLKIERCNARIAFKKPQREETYQVTLEALKLSPCYPAFLITAEVPEIYMHQFWNTITKIRDTDAYSFKLDKKKCRVDTEVFREILQICPILPNQEFVALPSEEELLSFIKELGYSGKCNMLSAIHTDQMHSLGEHLQLSLTDFMYQADNREISSARKEHMPYPRFTKVIISHFISKDKTISMRNGINLHTIRDDSLLGTLKFVSKTEDSQKYGALIPDGMINQIIKDSKAYKTYYDFATGKIAPKKARKFKKIASPSRKLSPVLEAEPVKKAKRVKRPAKKSTTAPTTGVVIRDTPGVSVSKKKAPAKADRGKGIELLLDAALLEDAQLKKALRKSKQDTHKLQASGLGDGVGFQPKVPDESEDKTTGTDEGTEEDDDLYKDVDVRSLGAEHEKERKCDEEMTDADQNVSQEISYEQVIEDAHVTLTSSQKTESSKQSSSVSSDFASKFIILDNVPPVVDEVASMMNVKNRQEESSTQAPSLFTVPEMAIPEIYTTHATTAPPTVSIITPLPQLTTSSPAPTTVPTTTSIPALPDFSSLFRFDQRVSTLETELSQLKQADHSAQLLESVKSQLPTMVDDLLSTRIGYATRTALQSYTKEFEKKAQEERKLYIDVVEKSIKDIIKDEVKSLMPQILPKEVSDFATPVIQSTINESLENVVLAKSSSQPKSAYEAAASLTEFELKKILLDKIEKSKSYQAAPEHRELYDGLVKSYNLDKDLFSSYGNVYSLKRDREDEDKDEDPPAGSNQGLKKR
ncbi:hypothetical protein Tco_0617138 [Tanacetum coccineum]